MNTTTLKIPLILMYVIGEFHTGINDALLLLFLSAWNWKWPMNEARPALVDAINFNGYVLLLLNYGYTS